MKLYSTDINSYSHALRTPLTGILGMAKKLQEASLTREQFRSVHCIVKASHELLHSIEQVEYQNSTNKSLSKDKKNKPADHPQLILLVEDNPMIQKIHSIMLKSLGFLVDIANNGKQALQLFHFQYAAVLMDIGLPDQSGIEITKKIRSHEQKNKVKAVPIIALTAFSSETTQEECIHAGMNALLTKPISQEKLGETIHFWLNVNSPLPTSNAIPS